MNKEHSLHSQHRKAVSGKSTVTALVANYIHNVMGIDVAVIDCDEPQHSIAGLRDKETALIEKNDSLKPLPVNISASRGARDFPSSEATPCKRWTMRTACCQRKDTSRKSCSSTCRAR